MAIIAIFSGSFCSGEEIADRTVEKLGYERVGNALIRKTSERYNISTAKLMRSLTGPPPIMNKLTHEREKNVASLRAVLAEMITRDNQVITSHEVHLLPGNISHVIKVLIIANHDFRIKQAMQQAGRSSKEAQKIIQKSDKDFLQWTEYLFEKSPFDESLYDIVIPMHDSSVDDAVQIIIDNVNSPAVETTEESLKSVKDFVLASRVSQVLVGVDHTAEVTAASGYVTIAINDYVIRLEQHKQELKQVASQVEGVVDVKTRIGERYSPPSILPIGEFEMPKKILLVDDEKEFVHTLSERLLARDLESAVVYDGEQALDFVRKDEPDVMVLDLKMPGIDGIEVLRRVKRDHPNIEVIILTGHGSEREETLALELGAFAYLHKPVDIEILSQTMRDAYKKMNQGKNLDSDAE